MASRRLLKTISDILLLSGLLFMSITGIGLYLAPTGKVARLTGWTWLGLDKHTLGEVHAYFGFTMICVALLHLYLNWKPLLSLLKNLNKFDVVKVVAAIALVVAVVIYLQEVI